ncbi:unnamed protein product [Trichogramma brassicae]|uniref:Uncharacterized protein n=1 Tax=Trichogramma brassicae TaxID=86971 RepID=A0A6H5IZH6_9HYME|nr:unnamed protein product [Trichogramma brassicae]
MKSAPGTLMTEKSTPSTSIPTRNRKATRRRRRRRKTESGRLRLQAQHYTSADQEQFQTFAGVLVRSGRVNVVERGDGRAAIVARGLSEQSGAVRFGPDESRPRESRQCRLDKTQGKSS